MATCRVLISSPADVAAERARAKAAVEEVAEFFADAVDLRAWVWEDEVPPGSGVPQELVDRRLAEKPYDIYVGIMWKVLGTPTPSAESGTVAEYRAALEAKRAGRVREVMFYFCLRDVPLHEAEQVQDVLRFREEVRRGGLPRDYREPEEFERLFRRHLREVVRELVQDAQARAAVEQSPAQEVGVPDDDRSADLLELRLRLEAKLTWLAKHLLGTPERPAYLNIGSLRADGYLTAEQAHVATRVMTVDAARAAANRSPDDFEDEANSVVATIRAIVFDAYAQRLARQAGWQVDGTFDTRPGHRPDFVIRRDGRTLRISARLSTDRESILIRNTLRRLERGDDDPPDLEARFVVIPDVSRFGDAPGVLRLEAFRELIA